ncbi:archaetidylserine decarboxylase [Gammaproteobacteria bacterium]|nr:archaetidylserine decarboxylase [Gammaproteobacteria bacterium]
MFIQSVEKLVTAIVYFFARYRLPIITPLIIWSYVRFYSVNESESMPWHQYRTLMALFTRQIDLTQRKKPQGNCLVSPCDGTLSAWGELDDTQAEKSLVIKGQGFCPQDLMGDDWLKDVQGGHYFSIYLSPKDYHRFHSPMAGLIPAGVRHLSGRLRSVHPKLFDQYPTLLSENERVACRYRTQSGHVVVMVFVGAMIVGSVNLTHQPNGQPLEQGADIGCFNFGSSIVMFVSKDSLSSVDVQPGSVALFDVLGEIGHVK